MSILNPLEQADFVHAQHIGDMDAGVRLFTFPDGFSIFSQGTAEETELIYNEVFVKQEYLGGVLSLDGCRYGFDVGANIGFFTIFAKLRNPDLILHAFEPLPETFAVLAKNVTLHNLQHVHLHNCAVGATDGSQRTLTYYPHAPGNSTAHPKTKVELKQLLSELLGQEQADYLFSAPQEHTVRTCSISAVIEQLDIPQIDLLKIDTESDELEVLRGIADWHFPHIRQIALEAHSEGERAEIEKLLANNGYGLFSEAGIAAGNTVRAIRR